MEPPGFRDVRESSEAVAGFQGVVKENRLSTGPAVYTGFDVCEEIYREEKKRMQQDR